MLHRLIPAPLHRVALRIAHGLRKRWWRWRRPRVTGCCVIALDSDGRVLLVRHSYGQRSWTLPGGALGRGEDPAQGARRELREEVGCRLVEIRSVAVLSEGLHGAENIVHLYAGTTRDAARADRREIVEVGFFPRDDLPRPLARVVSARLRLLDASEQG